MEKFEIRAIQHKTLRLSSYRSPMYDKKGNRFDVPIPVEQRFAKEFNNKANGHPKSDISRLIDSTSSLEMQQLLSKMRGVSTSQNDSSKLTLEQKFLATKPRFVDTPNERERFLNYAMNQTGLSEDDLFEMSLENKKEDESHNNSTVTPPNPE